MAKRKRLKTRQARAMAVSGFVILIALVAFFAYRAFGGEAAAEVTYTTGTVEKITLTSSVSGTGNAALSGSATVAPSVSGVVTGLSVAVGDTVEAGQLLFTIVNPELDLAVTSAENAYNEAELNLSKAELSVLQAKQSLSNLQEQYAAQSTSATTKATSTTKTPGTASSTTSTTAASTTTTTAPPTTTSAAATARMYLVSLSSDGTEQTVAQTVAQTTSNITSLDIKAARQAISSAELAMVSAQTQLESAELAVETAKANAAEREVTAPISGTITALDIADGDTIGGSSGSSSTGTDQDGVGDSGDSSSGGGSSTLTITDLDVFTVTITLAESDISAVKLGQKAIITFDALPDLSFTGKVTAIDTTGSNDQGVVSYGVTITPDVTDPVVKGGMTVSVNIITQVATDVLAVPSTAVKSQGNDGGKYVQVLENGTPVDVTVETGMSTDSYTEITSGLSEDQEIIVQTITTSSGATSTTVRSSGGILDQGGSGEMPSGEPPSGGAGFTPPGR